MMTPYTVVMAKYRGRTWLRGHLPWAIAQHIPKGHDCGRHDWYLEGDGLDACYHCQVTRPHIAQPLSASELELLETLAVADSPIAAKALADWVEDGRLEVELVMHAAANPELTERIEYRLDPAVAAAWLQKH